MSNQEEKPKADSHEEDPFVGPSPPVMRQPDELENPVAASIIIHRSFEEFLAD